MAGASAASMIGTSKIARSPAQGAYALAVADLAVPGCHLLVGHAISAA